VNAVFADTSGLLALLNAKDDNHARAARTFAPLIEVVWVDEALHDAGLDLLLERRQRLLSLVDAVSFVTMQRTSVAEAFAFDPHFEQEGFSLVR
jgi:predicted nucleic acid-binding protein